MSDGNLNASKLFEQASNRLDSNKDLYSTSGLPIDESHSSNLSFVSSCLQEAGVDHGLPGRLDHTDLGGVLDGHFRNEAARQAVANEHSTALSYLVGVTENDLDASELTLPTRLLEQLENDGALTTLLAAGDPNTGKTNTMSVVTELSQAHWDDLLVISNVSSWELTDVVVTSCHDLAVTLLEHRDRPKLVLIDEGSTHFDARTNSYEVASQWSPLLKRMSKLGVEVVGVVGHTGKDLDPELKRLTSLAFYKTAKDNVEFFESWPADSDRPDERLFGGSLENLEATAATYDPDDSAPWAWNLEPDLFSQDLPWDGLLRELKTRGPDD